jgi:hypothetical protein
MQILDKKQITSAPVHLNILHRNIYKKSKQENWEEELSKNILKISYHLTNLR